MKWNLELEEARTLLASLPVQTMDRETVELSQALSRVLAGDVLAQLNAPPFDRSPYDGYAFRGEDTASASAEHPVTLRVLEEIPAGTQPHCTVTAGTAVKILTGAPIPPGANATVKYEETTFGPDWVRLTSPMAPNSNVVYAGEDIRLGATIAQRGTVLDPALLGALASQGFSEVEVYRRPRVSILNTGSELAPVGQPLQGAQIYNSNGYTLGGYLRQFGCTALDAGIVEDQPETIAQRAAQALMTADMLVTTGGASVGDYDYAVRAAEMLGAEILFWKANFKPGGALMAAVRDGKLILGLSGNPGAAALGLHMVALPYIKRLCGRRETEPERITVRLLRALNKPSEKLRLLRGRLVFEGGQACISFDGVQTNGAVASLSGCNLIGKVEAGRSPLAAGELIEAEYIGE